MKKEASASMVGRDSQSLDIPPPVLRRRAKRREFPGLNGRTYPPSGDLAQQHGAQNLVRLDEVMQVRARIVPRRVATALLVERAGIGGVAGIAQIDRAEAEIGEAMAAVAVPPREADLNRGGWGGDRWPQPQRL